MSLRASHILGALKRPVCLALPTPASESAEAQVRVMCQSSLLGVTIMTKGTNPYGSQGRWERGLKLSGLEWAQRLSSTVSQKATALGVPREPRQLPGR